MGKLRPILVAAVLVALTVAGPALGLVRPAAVAAATTLPANPKIAIIVGATEATTTSYRSYADAEYAEAIKYTPNVVKVYSPDATWDAVQAAVDGAAIVIYHGHGNGWPAPYPWDPTFATRDGFGLNASASGTDDNNKYYGEPYVSSLHFAPNAIVLLHNLCYASGNSEPGNPAPTQDVAMQRADNFAAGFLAAGAKAVIADGHASAVTYLRRLFTVDETLLSNWRNQLDYHGNEFSFASNRTPGATVAMDPDNPGSGYYRSIAGNLGTRSVDITGITLGTYSPVCDGANLRTAASTTSTSKAQLTTGAILTVSGLVSGGSWTTNCPNDCPTIRSGTSWYAIDTINGQSVGSLYGVSTLYVATGTLAQDIHGTPPPAPTPTPTPSGTPGPTPTPSPTPSPTPTPVPTPTPSPTPSPTPGATYVSVTPNRLLDSRVGSGFSGALQVGVARSFQVTGRTPGSPALNVPANAIAVTGNLTVTNATAGGWLSLTPTLDNNPPTSTLNFPAGDSRANGVTVPLGAGGILSVVYNGAAAGNTTHALFDVTGYFVPDLTGATYVALTPNRLLDSRSGSGFTGPLGVGAAGTFQVTGRNAANIALNVPSTAIAVTGNLTVANATAGGWLSLTPTPDNNPATSTLNFPAGDTRANGITVRLGTGGTLSVAFNGPAAGNTTDAIFDVTGYFLPGTSGATYVAVTPNRLADSRFGNGIRNALPVAGACVFQATNRNGGTVALNVPSNAVAVTGNLTVTGQSAGGWLSITPTVDSNPATSTLNFPRGDDRANGVTVQLGSGGVLSVAFNGPAPGNTAQAVFDVTGYFIK